MSEKDIVTVVSDRYSYGEKNPPGTPIEMDRKEAQPLIDGGMMRLYQEPKRARVVSAQTSEAPKKPPSKSNRARAQQPVPVQINVASKTAIADGLKGIGDKLAASIVEVRSTDGAFENDEDLLSVEGITQKMITDNQGLIDYYIPPDAVEPE